MRSVERDAAYPHEEGAHEAQVAALSTASAEAHENVDALNRQLQVLQAQRADLKAQVAALQRKADHIEQIVTYAEPRTRWVPGWGERRRMCAVAWPVQHILNKPCCIAVLLHLGCKAAKVEVACCMARLGPCPGWPTAEQALCTGCRRAQPHVHAWLTWLLSSTYS